MITNQQDKKYVLLFGAQIITTLSDCCVLYRLQILTLRWS